MQKLRVGVLMGGKSIEREVSFNSGRTVCDHLDSNRYEIIPLFQNAAGTLFLLPWRFLHRGKISDFENRLATEAECIAWDSLKNYVDFIYNAMNGRYGEDGSLQGFLEILGIPYLGSKVYASALGMDKFLQKDFLRTAGIKTPNDIRLYQHDIVSLEKNNALLLEQLDNANIQFPCVVKPRNEGSSLGISIVKNPEDLLPAIKKAATIDPFNFQDVLIEEKIEGMEFTCIVCIDKDGSPLAMPPTEIVKDQGTDLFDYSQKYMPGRSTKFTPARCTPENSESIKKTCIDVMNILDMETIVRIDGFLTAQNTIVIIDPNTLCGMAPSSFVFCQAAQVGMNHTLLINHLIESELKNYEPHHIMRDQSKGTFSWKQ